MMDDLDNLGGIQRLQNFFTKKAIVRKSQASVSPAVQRQVSYRSDSAVLAGRLHLGAVLFL
jgi:hypothetical protein